MSLSATTELAALEAREAKSKGIDTHPNDVAHKDSACNVKPVSPELEDQILDGWLKLLEPDLADPEFALDFAMGQAMHFAGTVGADVGEWGLEDRIGLAPITD